MNKKLLTLAILSFGVSAAQAAPLVLQPGPLYFQFNNIEQAGPLGTNFAAKDLNNDGINDVGPGTNEFNWGVFNVSSVQNGAVSSPNEDISGGPAYFSDDGVGGTRGQVSGIFYGLELGNSLTHLTGGFMDLYWEDAATDDITNTDLNGSLGPGIRTDWNSAGKFTDGVLLARLVFATGIITGDTSTTVSSTSDPLNLSGTGIADGFANVMDINNDGVINSLDGAWAAALNGDWFHVDPNNDGIIETRDFRFTTVFQNQNLWDSANGVQGLRSNDPARAFVIPEPTSLALLGIGLMGFAGSRRRKA